MAIIDGTLSNDTLTGGVTDDVLYGYDGDDTLDGGLGDDTLYGGGGNDTYLFGSGYGKDWIYDNAGTNRIQFSALPTNVTLERTSAYGVTIRINGTNDQITIGNWFLSPEYRVTDVLFSNLAIWDASMLSTAGWGIIPVQNGTGAGDYLTGTDGGADTINGLDGNDVIYSYAGDDTIDGGAGDDRIYGSDGNDTITGGAGNDKLFGGAGNDVYKFGWKSGKDVVYDGAGTGSDLNTILMDSDVLPSDVTAVRLDGFGGVTLKLTNPDPLYDAQITLNYSFTSPIFRGTQVVFNNGTVWSEATLLAATWGTIPALNGTNNIDYLFGTDGGNDTIYGLDDDDGLYGYGGNDTLNGGNGNDDLIGGDGNDMLFGDAGNDNLYGVLGDDILDGGSGNDMLYGGWGSDTYRWGRGSGQDTVIDSLGYANDLNVIQIVNSDPMDAVVVPADIILTRTDADGVTLRINGTTDQITIAYFFTSASYKEIKVTFADGTIWFNTTLATAGWGTVPTQNGSAYNDALYGTDGGADTINGNGGDDTIFGYAGNDTLNGGDGNDTINPGAGNDTINGGTGIDTLYYTSSPLLVTVNLGTTGAQAVSAAKTDTISGIENLVGSFYNDTLTGDDNNNIIDGGPGVDTLNGGGGIDTLSYEYAAGAVNVNLGALPNPTVTGGGGADIISNFENITGSEYNDTLTGDGNPNTIIGGYGNDLLEGGAGIDTVSYADAGIAGVSVSLAITAAQDTRWGIDTLSGFENLTGSAYDDTLAGDATNNVIDGGAGTDTLTYAAAASYVSVDLSLTSAQDTKGAGIDTILNIENLVGSAFNDILTGNSFANVLDGGIGADSMSGGLGDDTYYVDNGGDGTSENSSAGTDLVISSVTWTLGANIENLRLLGGTINGTGNSLNNLIYAGSGINALDGSSGIDTLSYAYATAAVIASLFAQSASGGSGTDSFSNFENLTGSAYNDTLSGDAGDNVLDGGDGDDTITYASATSGVTLNLLTALASGWGNDTVYNIENIIGSDNDDDLTGNNHDTIISGGAGNDFMDGGWGNDTLDYSSATSGVTISLALLTAQNTGGAGTDTIANFENITGSASADNLTGDGNDNILDGGGGADTMRGGMGNDTYYVNDAMDVTIENASEGTDLVISSVTLTLANNIENLRLGATTINGTGNGLNNIIYSGTGNNILNGGTGTDTVSYLYATSGVIANLSGATGGGGADTLSGFENLTGSNFNDSLTGDANANIIDGGDGSDTLDMQSATTSVVASLLFGTSSGFGGNDTLVSIENITGGSGNDTIEGNFDPNILKGGLGTDTLTYVNSPYSISVDLAIVVTQETGGGGYDTITEFENVIGTADDDIIGGNSGNNVLDGGAGIDTVSFVSNTSTSTPVTVDLAAETASGFGTDTILNFENILGSTSADFLYGNAGDNVIDGRAGSDQMYGRGGNDDYWLSAATDAVLEDAVNGGSGIDTVHIMFTAAADYILPTGVENIIIETSIDLGGKTISLNGESNFVISGLGTGKFAVGTAGGSDTISYYRAPLGVDANLATGTAIKVPGTIPVTDIGIGIFTNLHGSFDDDTLNGSTANNVIFGDEGNDTINGNTGNDTLTGGYDQDTFVFNTALNASTNVNTITDFSATDDTIQLENAIFTALTVPGTLSSANFAANATGTATDTNDFILYNTTTGALYYDSDGTGATAAIQFALLGTMPSITNVDFIVI